MIIEPVLKITKTTPATNIEAADTVTYTITVQHTAASTANAYDLELIDTLPIQLEDARSFRPLSPAPAASATSPDFLVSSGNT